MPSAMELPKIVRFFEDERLELDDIEALQQLDADLLKKLFRSLIGDNPVSSNNGWIFKGFSMTGAIPPGLTAELDAAVIGVAVDAEGRLILNTGASSILVALTPSVTNYVYLYVSNVPSDIDGRRRYDRVSSSEASVNEETRFTPTIGLRVATSPETTYLVNDETVPLIPLYEFATDATGITSTTDKRPWFGTEDATFSLSGANGRGIGSLHELYSAIAKRFQTAVDPAAEWWDQGSVRNVKSVDDEVKRARTNLDSGINVFLQLIEYIEAARLPTFTVGPGFDETDYMTGLSLGDYYESILKNLLERTDALAGGIYHIKKGTYTLPNSAIVMEDRAGTHILGTPCNANGVPGGVTSTFTTLVPTPGAFNSLHFDTCHSYIVENIHFDCSTVSGEWQILLQSCDNIIFRGCAFDVGPDCDDVDFFSIEDCGTVIFENCTFYKDIPTAGFQGLMDVKGTSTRLILRDCEWEVGSSFILSSGNLGGEIIIENCTGIFNATSTVTGFFFNTNFAGNDFKAKIHNNKFKFNETGSGNVNLLYMDTSGSLGFTTKIILDFVGNECIDFKNTQLDFGSINGRSIVKDNLFITANSMSSPSEEILVYRGGENSYEATLIEGNTFNMAGDGYCIYLRSSLIVSSNTNGCVVRNNKIFNCEVGITNIGNNLIDNCTINDNIIINPVRSGIFLQPSADAKNLVVNGNQVRGNGNNYLTSSDGVNLCFGIVVENVLTLGIQTVSVSGNVVEDFGATTLAGGGVGGIYVGLTGKEILIDSNRVYSIGNLDGSFSLSDRIKCAGIVYRCLNNNTRIVKIRNNQVEKESWGACIAYDINSAGTATGKTIDLLEISKNQVRELSTGNIETSGIVAGPCYGASNPTPTTSGIRYLRCCNNMVEINSEPHETNFVIAAIDLSNNRLSPGSNNWPIEHANVSDNVINCYNANRGIKIIAFSTGRIVTTLNNITIKTGGIAIQAPVTLGTQHLQTNNVFSTT